MSPLQTKVLWALAIFGPLSIRDLADRLDFDREDVYRIVYRLQRRGLAIRLRHVSWDITQAGRAAVTRAGRVAANAARRPLFSQGES